MMAVTTASAPGKVILFGEHAVVYGQPAIAAPVTQVAATAEVRDTPPGTPAGVRLIAPDLAQETWLATSDDQDALAAAVRQVQAAAGLPQLPNLTITVHSSIPIASGLGSGAAIAAAVIRALTRHLGRPDLATAEQVAALAYEVEKIHHGTPSGIDNTVVAYEQPVWFVRGQPPEPFVIAQPVTLVIGDTGIASPTSVTVGDVRRGWQAEPQRYETISRDEVGVHQIAGGRVEGHDAVVGRVGHQ